MVKQMETVLPQEAYQAEESGFPFFLSFLLFFLPSSLPPSLLPSFFFLKPAYSKKLGDRSEKASRSGGNKDGLLKRGLEERGRS
jgi:hypothetical protein